MRHSTHLEGDHGQSHHRCPNHGEGIFPPEQARVEETDAGNHDPDEGGGCEDPCDVAGVVDGGGTIIGIEPLKGSLWRRGERSVTRDEGEEGDEQAS